MGKIDGRRVAIFGATGGIGEELCRYILVGGGVLIMVGRSEEKLQALQEILQKEFPNAQSSYILCELEEMESVENVCKELREKDVDILIHNAGAYSIPRRICDTGYDNVYQINFVSPYYITRQLLSHLEEKNGIVVTVGSIAHNYSRTDEKDWEFSMRTRASLVYGNAKRQLMFAVMRLASEFPKVNFAITHPGITFTNITNHYPKWIFFLIKNPMKVIFMKPKKAALSILQGVFETTGEDEWIGPRWFNVWGGPSKKRLHTCREDEKSRIDDNAKKIYEHLIAKR